MTFANLGLSACLLQAVNAMEYTEPTLIQRASIPILLGGEDIVGIAQTGTGKTAAFGLPMLQMIEGLANADASDMLPLGLVLCSTRELAIQTAKALSEYAKFSISRQKSLQVVAIYGGAPIDRQIKDVRNASIIVATPGRLMDLMKRKVVKLNALKMVVLDEADEMLKMGFAEDVESILATTNSNFRQTALFSATMPPAIRKIAAQYMHNPQEIQVAAVSSTSDNIEQSYAVVPFSKKTEATHRLIISAKAKGIIIFTKTRKTTDTVAAELMGLGITAAAISGDVPQATRENIIKRLRSGLIRVLVATDVAARGLDIDNVELVINYDLPQEPELYVHRIGRTGRAGRKGKAISFVTPKEVNSKLKAIEKLTKQSLIESEIPSKAEISKKLIKNYFDLIDERAHTGKLNHFLSAVHKRLEAIETQEELVNLIAAAIALGIGDDGENHTDNIEAGVKDEPRERGSYNRQSYPKRRGQSQSGGRNSNREYNTKDGHRDRRKQKDRFRPKKASGKPSSGAKARRPKKRH